MHRNETRAAELAEAEAELKRLNDAQFAASMSDDFYYTSGRKWTDDAEILKAKERLAALKKADAEAMERAMRHDHGRRMRSDGSTF